MKKTLTRILTLTLAVLLALSLFACAKTDDKGDATNDASTTNAPDNTAAPAPEAEPDSNLEIKVYALNGTTALGMAQLMSRQKAGTTGMNYNISTHAAADAITGAIISGECAIAALPTNVAVKLYHKSNGKLQLLALNTLGVLYLLTPDGENITSLDQLSGKTIYLPGAGSNPEYITSALLSSAGVKEYHLDTTSFPSPDALVAAVAAGKAQYAVLPEPKVSAATAQNSSIKVALDLTAEWEKLNGEGTLVQGCLVVNTAFAKAHPTEIARFLSDYEQSVNFIREGSDEAISMIVDAKIIPAAPIAKKALPKCNICFIAGADMKPLMNTFCEKIFAADNSSIGKMPDDGFYYVG